MNPGDRFTIRHIVAENETAENLGSGGLPVYATPAMICLMERTACSLAANEGHHTVGTKVDISHVRACLTGTELESYAELVEVEGRRLLFKVGVSDSKGVLGEGLHERYVIDPERFMSRLNNEKDNK